MVAEQKPAVVDVVDNILRAIVRVVRSRHIVEHEHSAGDRLHGKDEQQDRTEHVGPTRASRNRLIEHLRLHFLEPKPFIEKGENLFTGAGLMIRDHGRR